MAGLPIGEDQQTTKSVYPLDGQNATRFVEDVSNAGVVREPDAGELHVRFDVAGAGNVTIGRRIFAHSEMWIGYPLLPLARQYSTLPCFVPSFSYDFLEQSRHIASVFIRRKLI